MSTVPDNCEPDRGTWQGRVRMRVRLDFQPAGLADLPAYLSYSKAAQERIRAKGLAQYLPAAHDEYAEAMRRRIDAGSLVVVRSGAETAPVAFFNFEPARSNWWPEDEVQALYLAGVVVAPEWSGHGIGGEIIGWCVRESVRRGFHAVRLDCHAGNPWLRRYYESHGFVLKGYVSMHPGYDGCLYELGVVDGGGGTANLEG